MTTHTSHPPSGSLDPCTFHTAKTNTNRQSAVSTHSACPQTLMICLLNQSCIHPLETTSDSNMSFTPIVWLPVFSRNPSIDLVRLASCLITGGCAPVGVGVRVCYATQTRCGCVWLCQTASIHVNTPFESAACRMMSACPHVLEERV